MNKKEAQWATSLVNNYEILKSALKKIAANDVADVGNPLPRLINAVHEARQALIQTNNTWTTSSQTD